MSWFRKPATHPTWAAACKHLAAADPAMKQIMAKVGRCTLKPRRDYFIILCRAIFAQQLSTKIADILFKRFLALFPRRRPTPRAVMKALAPGADESRLKRVGLSRQKRAYLLDLARHFDRGEIPTR